MFYSLLSIRHSAVFFLGKALIELFPTCQLIDSNVNPAGFFYDVLIPIRPPDIFLTLLEEKMRGEMKKSSKIDIVEMMATNVASLFHHQGQEIRANRLEDEVASGKIDRTIEMQRLDGYYDFVGDYRYSIEDGIAFKITDFVKIQLDIGDYGPVDVYRIFGTAYATKDELTQALKLKKKQRSSVGANVNSLYVGDWTSTGQKCLDALYGIVKEEFKSSCSVRTSSFIKETDLSLFYNKKGAGLSHLMRTQVDEWADVTIGNQRYVIPNTKSPLHLELVCQSPGSWIMEMFKVNSNRSSSLEMFPHENIWETKCIGSVLFSSLEKEGLSTLISSLQFIEKTFKILGLEGFWSIPLPSDKALKSLSPKMRGEWTLAAEFLQSAFRESQVNVTLEPVEFIPLDAECAGPKVTFFVYDLQGNAWPGPFLGIDLHYINCLHKSFHDLKPTDPLKSSQARFLPAVNFAEGKWLKCSMFGVVEGLIGMLAEKGPVLNRILVRDN